MGHLMKIEKDINKINEAHLAHHEEFMSNYLAGDLTGALNKLDTLKEMDTNLQGYYTVMYRRIYGMYDNKELNWSGFYVLDSK